MKGPFSFRESYNKVKVYVNDFIVIVFILFILLSLFTPLFLWGNICSKDNNSLVDIYSLLWTVFASFVAVVLYLKRDKDNADDYLIQSTEIVEVLGCQKIRTTLSNPTPFDRKVDFACLIVTKEGSSILQQVNEKMNTSFINTNSLIDLKHRNSLFESNFAFIPLDYYFSENIHVGNENLVFELMIDNDLSQVNNYNVRFFVFRPKTDSNAYHRSVSAVFKAGNIKSAFAKLEANLKEAEDYRNCKSNNKQKQKP